MALRARAKIYHAKRLLVPLVSAIQKNNAKGIAQAMGLDIIRQIKIKNAAGNAAGPHCDDSLHQWGFITLFFHQNPTCFTFLIRPAAVRRQNFYC
ncbi:hypothetical protein FE224_03205 [Serratia marcescens]|uniref:hypothetical protein n=1 Tax=Serratia TaxID=613 RepID=UPI000F7D7393|nr:MULTISPECIES: hypothetical protein [Serratia]EIT7182989.1 hypothetical protein [Serratia marcescens]EJC6390739.1 hypothetical protein [Serratia marcescens]MBH2601144.1 hypothetical protein [Serratia marcescens]MBH2892084.1 hypothetical protein [Serratia marcescens]MBN5393320.1 hypothetical protein [Serratia marcescens]